MLTITRRELVLLTICGALLGAASNASYASNVYKPAPSQADELVTTKPQPGYWACPAEYSTCSAEVLPVTAKADGSRTDAPVSDTPEQPTWSLKDWSQYYDYGALIQGD